MDKDVSEAEYEEGVVCTEIWFAGDAYPPLSKVRAGDIGHLKIPERTIGCGSEVSILGALRHCVHFENAESGRYFHECSAHTWNFMQPHIGLPHMYLLEAPSIQSFMSGFPT